MNFDDDDECLCNEQCGNGLAGFDGMRYQQGFGSAGFDGIRYQKGFGLFGNLFAKAWPYLKQFGKYVGKKLFGLGVDIVGDVADGKSIKESAKERAKSTVKSVAEDGKNKLQTLLMKGNGLRRRVVKKVKRKLKKTCRQMKVRKSNKRRKVNDHQRKQL